MAKPVTSLMTPGMQNLNIPLITRDLLFKKAEELHLTSPFLTFEPVGSSSVRITDGNGNELGTLPVTLQKRIWIIFDDYGDKWVATGLLPEEY